MVDGCQSKLVNVLLGVPQESVLGPLLFLLYTSELFSILENKLIGYADDSTLMAVVRSPEGVWWPCYSGSDILNSKITFEKNLRSVSRAASERLGILRKSRLVFHYRSLIFNWEMLSGFCPASFGVLFRSVVLGCRYAPKNWIVQSEVPGF